MRALGAMKLASGVAMLALTAGTATAHDSQITSVSQLPPAVAQALTSLCAPCSFADVNGPWEATDAIVNNLPQRRLVRVSHAGAEWIIEYEHGGRGHHMHTATFSTQPQVHFVRGSCGSEVKCEW